jgi:putative FmdB family regulatory protein
MPLYEYQCESCGHRFELIQKFSDPPAETCPACGGAVRKLVSSPAFQFKGTGWYVTDYARKSDGSSESKGESSKPEAADSSKGESSEKPADKPAEKPQESAPATKPKS